MTDVFGTMVHQIHAFPLLHQDTPLLHDCWCISEVVTWLAQCRPGVRCRVIHQIRSVAISQNYFCIVLSYNFTPFNLFAFWILSQTPPGSRDDVTWVGRHRESRGTKSTQWRQVAPHIEYNQYECELMPRRISKWERVENNALPIMSCRFNPAIISCRF